MRLLQLDSLMTSYTEARPEDGLFVPLPRRSRQLDAVGDNGQLIQSSPRTRRAPGPLRGSACQRRPKAPWIKALPTSNHVYGPDTSIWEVPLGRIYALSADVPVECRSKVPFQN